MSKILGFVKAAAGQPFQIRNKTTTKAEIILYASIGESFWGDSISAKQFSDELKALPETVNEITVRINSPGGDVFDGITIYNRLKQHKAKIIVHIDGLCASIASIIALAADDGEIHIGEGALYMIHLPWTWGMGNRMDFDNISQRLTDIEDQMISIYKKKCGLDRTEIKAMLEAETWLDSDQAIEKGFVDKKTEESVEIAASVFDRAKWINKVPRKLPTHAAAITAVKDGLKKKIEDRLKSSQTAQRPSSG